MQGIRNIVNTMKTLSVINASPYEHAARSIETYHAAVLDGLHAFLHKIGPIEISSSNDTREVLIVFGSDHGLCGNYNEALASHIVQQLGDALEDTTVLCVGAQMADALQGQEIVSEPTFLPPASVDGIGRLANLLTQYLDEIKREKGLDEIAVTLAYFARDGRSGQRPILINLLPLDRDLVHELQIKPWVSRSLPSFTMASPELFIALIRSHLFASLFRAAAEALVTENAARLALMQRAEQSVDDRLDDLKSEARSVRQSEITTELLDMIIGFEALKKRRRIAAMPDTRPPEGPD